MLELFEVGPTHDALSIRTAWQELHEFAVLVRDLQLYASFDTNFDGTIDSKELAVALGQLGLKHPATESAAEAQKVLELWDLDGDGLLNLSEFSQLASDVRIFRDADVGGTGMLGLQELTAALQNLGIQADACKVLERCMPCDTPVHAHAHVHEALPLHLHAPSRDSSSRLAGAPWAGIHHVVHACVPARRYQWDGFGEQGRMPLGAYGRAIRDLNAPARKLQPKARMSRRPSAISIKNFRAPSLINGDDNQHGGSLDA